MTPNQISAASGPTTGASTFCAIGATIGRMMKAISKKSRKNAREKMKRLMKIGKPQTPPGSEVRWGASQTPPETPRNTTEKQVERIRMESPMEGGGQGDREARFVSAHQ